MSIETLPAEAGRLPLPLYVARPTTDGPWPGVVVVHDVQGLGPDLRDQADWLADTGYLAVGPDLLAHGRRLSCLRALFADLAAGEGPRFLDIERARAWLVANPNCTGRVGVIGFCVGGGFALLLAAPPFGYQAASVNYGRVPPDAARRLVGACPIVASYGGRDRSLRGAADRLAAALGAAGVDYDVVEYPDAGHGFLNHHASLPLRVGLRLAGGGFHPVRADQARARIRSFFDRHLRTDDPPAPESRLEDGGRPAS